MRVKLSSDEGGGIESILIKKIIFTENYIFSGGDQALRHPFNSEICLYFTMQKKSQTFYIFRFHYLKKGGLIHFIRSKVISLTQSDSHGCNISYILALFVFLSVYLLASI